MSVTMYTTVGRLSSYISQGVYTVSGPFHPFGGAVDIVVVEQPDGSFKSTPWYVKFGKFQGVLKRREKTVSIGVNDVDANFHMYLDHKGEAYFLEDASDDDEKQPFSPPSGPSSGDEGHDLALEYHKSVEQGGVLVSDLVGDEASQGVVVLESDARLELQFSGEEEASCSVSVDKVANEASTKFHELLDEAVGINHSDSVATATTPAAALFASSALMSIESVAEKAAENGHGDMPVENGAVSSPDEVDGAVLEGSEDENKEDQSSVTLLSSRNGEYVINSYSVARGIEKSFVIKGAPKDDVLLEEKVGETWTEEIVHERNGAVVEDEAQVFEVTSSATQEVEQDAETELSISQAVEQDAKTELSISQAVEQDAKTDLSISQAVEQDAKTELSISEAEDHVNGPDEALTGKGALEEGFASEERESPLTDCLPKEPEISEVPAEENSQNATASNDMIVEEPPEDKVGELEKEEQNSAGGDGKQDRQPTSTTKPNSSLDNVERRTWGWWVWRGGASKPKIDSTASKAKAGAAAEVADTGKESIVNNKVDLSGAEVVLMSVDGHVVVAEQDEKTPRKDRQLQDPAIVEDLEKRVLEVTESSDLKSGSETAIEISEQKMVTTDAALHSSQLVTGLVRNGYWTSWNLTSNKTLIPTSEQLASLNLKPGKNKITFTFTTRVLGKQQVDARIYLWKWNTKVVISDVDGTITKSDVLGQVMPLVGRDWTQTGVARLFSAIKDNGYELIFLSARAISQAYLTRQFLVNLKQDGEALPDGPVVISPDGLFPSLYREVIRRAPHEFKIGCLEDIRALFPSECQPFYAGFGNRDTDEISYLKVGIPKGKIFIINPKGEVIVNNILDLKSYTSLHKLVNDMFPPVNLTEREDFNSWNFWKLPLPDVDDL